MSQIPPGDYLQFIIGSVSLALALQAVVFGLYEFITRVRTTRVERYIFPIPLLVIVTEYYYAGLCALPWFILSIFSCMFSDTFDILSNFTSIFLIVGWLIISAMVFDMIFIGLRGITDDWVEQHPNTRMARFIRFLRN